MRNAKNAGGGIAVVSNAERAPARTAGRGHDGRVSSPQRRDALVSVAAAAFVVLSDAGQADKAALRSIRSRVTGVGVPSEGSGPPS